MSVTKRNKRLYLLQGIEHFPLLLNNAVFINDNIIGCKVTIQDATCLKKGTIDGFPGIKLIICWIQPPKH